MGSSLRSTILVFGNNMILHLNKNIQNCLTSYIHKTFYSPTTSDSSLTHSSLWLRSDLNWARVLSYTTMFKCKDNALCWAMETFSTWSRSFFFRVSKRLWEVSSSSLSFPWCERSPSIRIKIWRMSAFERDTFLYVAFIWGRSWWSKDSLSTSCLVSNSKGGIRAPTSTSSYWMGSKWASI